MTKYFTFILLEFLFFSANSQKNELDTIVANKYFEKAEKYSGEKKLDTACVFYKKASDIYERYELWEKDMDCLNKLSEYYGFLANPDSAYFFAIKSLDICHRYFGFNNKYEAECFYATGKTFYERGVYKNSDYFLTKALNQFSQIYGDSNLKIADVYISFAALYWKLSKYDKMKVVAQSAKKIRMQHLDKNTVKVAECYHNIAIADRYLGNYEEAVENYNIALDIYLKKLGPKHANVARTYNNIGVVYKKMAEYELSLDYLLKALALRIEIFGEIHKLVSETYVNTADTYLGLSDYNNALKFAVKSLEIKKQIYGSKSNELSESYRVMGFCYSKLNNYDNALDCQLKSVKFRQEFFGQYNYSTAQIFFEVGDTYYAKSDFKNAIIYHKKAYLILDSIFQPKHPEKSAAANKLGKDYEYIEKYDSALYYYQKALIANVKQFSDTSIFSNPKISNFHSGKILLETLEYKANTFYQLSKDKNEIEKSKFQYLALKTLFSCDTLIDNIRKNFKIESDKIFLGEKAKKIYNSALNICNEIIVSSKDNKTIKSITNSAFYLSEKSKSMVLLEAMAGNKAVKLANIPDSLQQKEMRLNNQIAFYEKELAGEITDSAKIIEYNNLLFDLNRKYELLISYYETNFPKYYELKYAPKIVTTKHLQSVLDSKSAIVSYLISDSVINIFYVTNRNIKFIQSKNFENLNDSIEVFRNTLNPKSENLKKTYKIFPIISYELYNLLFPISIPKTVENILIIPDGNLGLIPFETLLTEKYNSPLTCLSEYDKLPYLISKYNISYNYSASLYYKILFDNNHETKVKQKKDLLAMAPVFDEKEAQKETLVTETVSEKSIKRYFMTNGAYISSLPATKTEIDTISNLFLKQNKKVTVKFHKEVTENFIKIGNISDYSFIHIATHGFVNSEKPELSGILLAQDTTGNNDGILYSAEIYNLKLNADLVVLSACETGLGKIKPGEGIIGLSRALLYAGAKNQIVSLWQVLDNSTSLLMADFYYNILNYQSNSFSESVRYSSSLRLAKQKMINEGKYSHPIYWSPFIIIGK
jgi:CHAT domain-containing protein